MQATVRKLRLGSWSHKENVFEQLQGNWPQLESLTTVNSIVNKAEFEALTKIEWPKLKTLWIYLDADAIQAVMQGNWPQLRDLGLHLTMASSACRDAHGAA